MGRLRVAESRWKPGAAVTASGAEEEEGERGRSAVWEGKLVVRILQKHGVVEGWTPEIGGALVAEGRFRARESTIRRTKGQGSIVTAMKPKVKLNDLFKRQWVFQDMYVVAVAVYEEKTMMLCYVTISLLSLSLVLFH